MEQNSNWKIIVLRVLSYILVAALSVMASFCIFYKSDPGTYGKLNEIRYLIDNCFIGQYDESNMIDGAANGMVEALGDRWSYYLPAKDVASLTEQMENAYVGIGVTVEQESADAGIVISLVEPESAADEAGILPGDVIVAVDGQDIAGKTIADLRQMIRGEEGTDVLVTIRRGEELTELKMTRRQIVRDVATYRMLPEQVGYVQIANFNEHCAEQTIAAIEDLLSQGAEKLLFDVRNNPGGYKSEMVKVLDYLLPEGVLFRSEYVDGNKEEDTSDSSCLSLPMAVLINADSYSAAEFFAAALSEYNWATVVGERTCGKGYFQYTYDLSDGSVVNLSSGKYFTPNGVSLAEVGGLEPNLEVKTDTETAKLIYQGKLEPEDDPQIVAALNSLKKS